MKVIELNIANVKLRFSTNHDDFMSQLTKEEFSNLKSQIAISSSWWGGRRKPPLVFTEHGALQAANVLNSGQANKMSVFIIRAFVRLREMTLKMKNSHEKSMNWSTVLATTTKY